MGWWSDVLADAIQRSKKLKIVACFTARRTSARPSPRSTAAPRRDYETILKDRSIEAIINTRRTTYTSRRRAPRGGG